MRYPFNKYGYYQYIEDPIRQVFIKLKFLRGIDIWPWDMCNAHEVVFAQFKYFCNSHPFYFLDQYALEYNCEDLARFGNISQEEVRDTYIKEKLEAFIRLSQIQEYVLNTRETNKAKLEFIGDEWFNSRSSALIPEKDDSVRDHYIQVDYWFELDELFYTITKEMVDTKHFNPLDIEYEMDKIDIAYAQEILKYKNYIWD